MRARDFSECKRTCCVYFPRERPLVFVCVCVCVFFFPVFPFSCVFALFSYVPCVSRGECPFHRGLLLASNFPPSVHVTGVAASLFCAAVMVMHNFGQHVPPLPSPSSLRSQSWNARSVAVSCKGSNRRLKRLDATYSRLERTNAGWRPCACRS